MIFVHHQADLIRVDLHNFHLLVLYRNLGDAKVHGIIEDSLHSLRSVRTHDLQPDARVVLLIVREYRRQDLEAGRLVGRDDELPPGDLLQLPNLVESLTLRLQDSLRVLGENLAGCGQLNAASEALKQLRSEFLLHLTDLRGNRRLRSKTRLSGLRKTLQADNLEEGMELVKVHGSPERRG